MSKAKTPIRVSFINGQTAKSEIEKGLTNSDICQLLDEAYGPCGSSWVTYSFERVPGPKTFPAPPAKQQS